VSLSEENLPIAMFPEARRWIQKPYRETELYYEVDTGHHLVLMRTSGFRDFMEYMTTRKLRYIDSEMHKYCRSNGKRWAATKKTKAVHLTWDSYSDSNHPYTRLKTSKPIMEHWNHDKTSSFTIYTKDAVRVVKA
jgi:hypothetical protein